GLARFSGSEPGDGAWPVHPPLSTMPDLTRCCVYGLRQPERLHSLGIYYLAEHPLAESDDTRVVTAPLWIDQIIGIVLFHADADIKQPHQSALGEVAGNHGQLDKPHSTTIQNRL